LYLATPTIFDQGWLPKWIDTSTLEGEYRGVKVKLIAATIPRYQTIGGWDVAHNKPKPTVRAVSAGSVYYFITSYSPDEILQAFHWQNLADNSSNAQIGYGLTLVGTWNYVNISKGEKP
jgi:CRISPR-associated protein Cmr3